MKSRILYEDEDMIVCHKPAGIATQTARVGQRDMISEITGYLTRCKKEKGEKLSAPPFVGVVHRLDQPVEGILVFAKNKQTAAALSHQIAGHHMEKYYNAIICGKDFKKQGELVDYMVKDGKTNMSRIVPKEVKDAKLARLSYQVLQEKKETTEEGEERTIGFVRIHLETGRHHQIRVQMKEAGMSLLGDYKYADEVTMKLSEQLQIKEIALCACELCLNHPKTGKRMHFQIQPEGKSFQIFPA